MMVIPDLFIDDMHFTFQWKYSDEHDDTINVVVTEVGSGNTFTIDIFDTKHLTKCSIRDLVYDKVESCLK